MSEVALDRLSWGEIRTWIVLGLAAVFFLLGWLFILAPSLGAAIFGIPPPEGIALGYVSALGFRDVALGLYIVALAIWSTRRAVAMVLGISALIPVGDVLLVALLMGSTSLANLVLHVAGGAALALAGLVTARG